MLPPPMCQNCLAFIARDDDGGWVHVTTPRIEEACPEVEPPAFQGHASCWGGGSFTVTILWYRACELSRVRGGPVPMRDVEASLDWVKVPCPGCGDAQRVVVDSREHENGHAGCSDCLLARLGGGPDD